MTDAKQDDRCDRCMVQSFSTGRTLVTYLQPIRCTLPKGHEGVHYNPHEPAWWGEAWCQPEEVAP